MRFNSCLQPVFEEAFLVGCGADTRTSNDQHANRPLSEPWQLAHLLNSSTQADRLPQLRALHRLGIQL